MKEEINWKSLFMIMCCLAFVGWLSFGVNWAGNNSYVPCDCDNYTFPLAEGDNWTAVCAVFNKTSLPNPNVTESLWNMTEELSVLEGNQTVELSADRIAYYKDELPKLLKNNECFAQRVEDTREDAHKGILNYAYDQPIVRHWEGSVFLLESKVSLKKIGKHIGPSQVHRMRYDTEAKETTLCDDPLVFAYDYEDLFGRQESDRS